MLVSVLITLGVLAVPGDDDSAAARFVDVTERTGIAFRHVCGSAEKDWIVEVNGSGVALLDHDGDGDLDVYLVNGSVLDAAPQAAERGDRDSPYRNSLFRNEGGWRFTDVTDEAGVGDTGWGCGVAVADIDNDGHLDLHVTNLGPNVLYRNLGDGRFERLRHSGAEHPGWGAGASFADFNRDGLVDIYLANYVEFDRAETTPRSAGKCLYKGVPVFCGPGGLRPAHDVLLLNLGGGRFRDASEAWGVRAAGAAYGLGTLVVDVQRDGFPDVIVANDTMANFCFINEGGERFSEAGLFLGLAYNDYGVAQAGMGLASGDTRGLGLDDIFVTNFEDDVNTLYLAERGRALFTDGTYAAGLGGASYRYLGWGTFFLDADGDADLDLFVANGHVSPQMDGVRSSIGYRQRNQLFVNDGRGSFRLAAPVAGSGLEVAKSSRGAACGDLDGDGDLDIVVSNIDDTPTVLENRFARKDVEWIAIRLRGTRSNRAAIGARVTLTAAGRTQERTVQSGSSYASQSELAARFAVPSRKAIERIRIEWPSGLVEDFPPETARTSDIVLTEGSASR